MRGRAVVAYQAHNLKVCGSIPHPATKRISASRSTGFFCAVKVPDTKGFAKNTTFQKSSLDAVALAKVSLILCFLGTAESISLTLK